MTAVPAASRSGARRFAPLLFLSALIGVVSSSPAPRGVAPRGGGALPPFSVTFVENRGQVADDALFHTLGGDTVVAFGASGLRYRQIASPTLDPAPAVNGLLPRPAPAGLAPAIHLDFVEPNAGCVPTGTDVLTTRVHVFGGPPERWRSGLSAYGGVVYRDLWPGVDLAYRGEVGRLKHELLVRPGADPARIRLRWRGASAVRIDPDGALVASGPGGPLRDERPVAYQVVDGVRREVEAAFDLSERDGVFEHGFRLGRYDPTHALVIDPVQIVYATYVGTSYHDRGLGVAVDAQGAAYVTGRMASPATMSYDAYVVKVAPDGASFAYVALIGGEGVDEGFDVAVDAKGAAYVVGPASSDDFPTPRGADTTFAGGQTDAYLAKLTPAGDALVFATFLGGSGTDFAEGVAVDAQGNAYVEGPTNSTQETFGVRVGPDLTPNGAWDLFVAKVTADGKTIAYAGFIGGAADDAGIGPGGSITSGHIGVDREGAAYVSGMTKSSEATFPTGSGFGDLPSFGAKHAGGYDAFAVKVRPDGTGLAWAGYVGGDADDSAFGMAIDAEGNAYMTGQVASAESTFPTGKGFGDLPGLDHTFGGGPMDGFLVGIAADGRRLLWATYFGGPKLDYGQALAFDPHGDLWVVGHAESPDFTVLEGPDSSFNGPSTDGDAFVAHWTSDGSRLLSCGFIGGSGDDHAYWVAVDPAGGVYVVGDTPSDEKTFPDGEGMASRRGVRKTYHGGPGDAFLLKVALSPADAAPDAGGKGSR